MSDRHFQRVGIHKPGLQLFSGKRSVVAAVTILMVSAATLGFGDVAPVVSPFYVGAEQTDARMIYVGGGSTGGRLAVDNHAEFMLARDDSDVVQNWCNGGTFKWSFGFFSFDGPDSEYPLFEANLVGSPAVTFDGGDKLRMILEPGFGYTLPSTITDGAMIDKIVISTSGQRPKDKGPAESPRGGGNIVRTK